ILGFCDDVQNYMLEADLAFLRGSPNSMMEAVTCNVPMIITGSLPGQEARNPEFAQMRGLGITCRSKSRLLPLINGLIENNAEGLNRIAEKQRYFRNFDNAADIARFLAETVPDSPPVIPEYDKKSPVLMQAAELYRRIEAVAGRRKEP
ncbi:MAG: UDP-N-acetylglucosamine--LPS N-acetylglucosamine transferase, partial [Oscillospiraceae bacterium]|nr:UDP-N-acetylglucosamine--LPS N-acetylglucosamine transferase [Oscillospiraceae bacterium]